MPVVLHLGAVGKREAQAAEDVDNLVLDDSEGVARTQLHGVGGTSEVEVTMVGIGCGKLLAQLGHTRLGKVFEFINADADFLLHLRGDETEVVHQLGNLSFFTQVLDAQCLQILGILGLHLIHFGQQFVYLVNHVETLFFKFCCKVNNSYGKNAYFCAKKYQKMLKRDYSLLGHNTFGMDVKAAAYVEYASVEELRSLLRSADFVPYRENFLVIGAGSNLLFQGDFDGLILHSTICEKAVVEETDEAVWVRVGSGVCWDDFVAWSVERDLHGAENLSAIPGEVGASAVQNIGAYGAEVCQLIERVEALDLDGQERIFTNEECRYGYRDSIFKRALKGKYVITYVTYRLQKQGELNLSYGNLRERMKGNTVRDVREAVCAMRASKLPDPALLGNAGSFFKNPVIPRWQYDHLRDVYPSIPCYSVDDEQVKVPAGWLIEQCGWKGRTLGRVAVHEHQALVLVNRGGATGDEVVALAANIVGDVQRKFGIEISPEVNII